MKTKFAIIITLIISLLTIPPLFCDSCRIPGLSSANQTAETELPTFASIEDTSFFVFIDTLSIDDSYDKEASVIYLDIKSRGQEDKTIIINESLSKQDNLTIFVDKACNVTIGYEIEETLYDIRAFVSHSNDCGKTFATFKSGSQTTNTFIANSPAYLLNGLAKNSFYWEEEEITDRTFLYKTNNPLHLKSETDSETLHTTYYGQTDTDDFINIVDDTNTNGEVFKYYVSITDRKSVEGIFVDEVQDVFIVDISPVETKISFEDRLTDGSETNLETDEGLIGSEEEVKEEDQKEVIVIENVPLFYAADTQKGGIRIVWEHLTENSQETEFGVYELYKNSELIATIANKSTSALLLKEAVLIDGELHNFSIAVKDLNDEIITTFYSEPVTSTGDITPPTSPGYVSARETTEGSGGAIEISWDTAHEPDFKEYRLYRSNTQNFIPSDENLIAALGNPEKNGVVKGVEGGGLVVKNGELVQGDEGKSKIKGDEIVIKFSTAATKDEIETLIKEYQLVFKDEIDLLEKEIENIQENQPLFLEAIKTDNEKTSEEDDDYVGLRKKLKINHFTIPKAADIYNLIKTLEKNQFIETAECISSVKSFAMATMK